MRRFLIVVVVILAAAAGCSGMAPAPAEMTSASAPRMDESASRMMASEGDAAKAMAPAPPPSAGSPVAQTPPGSVAIPAERKVIRNGSLSLEVRRLDEALSAIRAATEKAAHSATHPRAVDRRFQAKKARLMARKMTHSSWKR